MADAPQKTVTAPAIPSPFAIGTGAGTKTTANLSMVPAKHRAGSGKQSSNYPTGVRGLWADRIEQWLQRLQDEANKEAAEARRIAEHQAAEIKAAQDALVAMKEIMEVGTGQLGDPNDQFVTMADLVDPEIIKWLNDQETSITRPDTVPQKDGSTGQSRIPDAPRNLQIMSDADAGRLSAFCNHLTWTNPDDPSDDISHIEVWIAESNDRSAALRTGIITWPQNEYKHMHTDPTVNYWYWIRAVDWAGNYSEWEPSGQTSGFAVQGDDSVIETIQRVINALKGEVPATWDVATAYVIGDRVKYDATDGWTRTYKCVQNCTGEVPCSGTPPTTNFAFWNRTGILSTGEVDGDAVVGIDGNMVVDGTIIARNIQANTITANEIAAGTITATEIFANTITADELAASCITADAVGANEIITNIANTKDGIIKTAHIDDAQIKTAHIDALQVTNAEIANLTVQTGKVVANAITNDAFYTADADFTLATTEQEIGTITVATNGGVVEVTAKVNPVTTVGALGATYAIFKIRKTNITGTIIDQTMELMNDAPHYSNAALLAIDSSPGATQVYKLTGVLNAATGNTFVARYRRMTGLNYKK